MTSSLGSAAMAEPPASISIKTEIRIIDGIPPVHTNAGLPHLVPRPLCRWHGPPILRYGAASDGLRWGRWNENLRS